MGPVDGRVIDEHDDGVRQFAQTPNELRIGHVRTTPHLQGVDFEPVQLTPGVVAFWTSLVHNLRDAPVRRR